MLGNFRFGYASDDDRDEYKRVAIEQAWEWVTQQAWLGISPERIYITVHHTDDEARKLWQEFVPRSEERRVGKSVDLGGRRIIKKKKTRAKRSAMCRQQ